MIGVDWQGLQLLLKAPKKKYIRKLMEYVVAISAAPSAISPHLTTPISQEFATDLELSVEESHQLLTSLIDFLALARELRFEESALRSALSSRLPQELTEILATMAEKLSEDISRGDKESVSQAQKLMNVEWALQMQVASDKGKANLPVVRLDVKTAKDSRLRSSVIEMKGTEFQVFFKNLQKMKQQLAQLVTSSD